MPQKARRARAKERLASALLSHVAAGVVHSNVDHLNDGESSPRPDNRGSDPRPPSRSAFRVPRHVLDARGLYVTNLTEPTEEDVIEGLAGWDRREFLANGGAITILASKNAALGGDVWSALLLLPEDADREQAAAHIRRRVAAERLRPLKALPIGVRLCKAPSRQGPACGLRNAHSTVHALAQRADVAIAAAQLPWSVVAKPDEPEQGLHRLATTAADLHDAAMDTAEELLAVDDERSLNRNNTSRGDADSTGDANGDSDPGSGGGVKAGGAGDTAPKPARSSPAAKPKRRSTKSKPTRMGAEDGGAAQPKSRAKPSQGKARKKPNAAGSKPNAAKGGVGGGKGAQPEPKPKPQQSAPKSQDTPKSPKPNRRRKAGAGSGAGGGSGGAAAAGGSGGAAAAAAGTKGAPAKASVKAKPTGAAHAVREAGQQPLTRFLKPGASGGTPASPAEQPTPAGGTKRHAEETVAPVEWVDPDVLEMFEGCGDNDGTDALAPTAPAAAPATASRPDKQRRLAADGAAAGVWRRVRSVEDDPDAADRMSDDDDDGVQLPVPSTDPAENSAVVNVASQQSPRGAAANPPSPSMGTLTPDQPPAAKGQRGGRGAGAPAGGAGDGVPARPPTRDGGAGGRTGGAPARASARDGGAGGRAGGTSAAQLVSARRRQL